MTFLEAIEQIETRLHDANKKAVAYCIAVSLNYLREKSAEVGIPIHEITFQDIIDDIAGMADSPLSGGIPLAGQVERAILRSQGRLAD